MADKPNVLILGGCGFVARHLVCHLVKNSLANKIRVADKSTPQISWFNEEQQASYENVEFVQANLVNPAHVDRVFASDVTFDYVINLAAETRYGQAEQVYNEHVYQLSLNVAKKAATCQTKRFVDVSTAQVYSSDKKASNETSKTEPWTSLATHKLKVENELKTIDGLDYIVVRPAIIYGIGDKLGITPRLIIGAVYKQMQEKMKLLWTKDLKMNTVHVEDVAMAIWFLCSHGNKGEVYNLADKQDSTQGSISDLVCRIFDIKYDFFGSVVSNLAKMNMSSVVDDSNEKHLAPWSQACTQDQIANTPLSPYLDKELLYNNHTYVDGSKIESLGFSYTKPEVKLEYLRAIVDDYVSLGIFPSSLIQP